MHSTIHTVQVSDDGTNQECQDWGRIQILRGDPQVQPSNDLLGPFSVHMPWVIILHTTCSVRISISQIYTLLPRGLKQLQSTYPPQNYIANTPPFLPISSNPIPVKFSFSFKSHTPRNPLSVTTRLRATFQFQSQSQSKSQLHTRSVVSLNQRKEFGMMGTTASKQASKQTNGQTCQIPPTHPPRFATYADVSEGFETSLL